jgi:hypothetical protein
MRSRYAIPEEIGFHATHLRKAGYYCTNNAKEDYNVARQPPDTWHESSKEAHWENRAPGQPFFAIFNYGQSHESSIFKSKTRFRHDPAKMQLPPYHPDIPEMREDWAHYYDNITAMDGLVGRRLKELEEAGLAGDTIVFYFSDHGGVLGRSKRFLYDSGTRVPLIIRFPKKYAHLASGAPGSHTDRLVSFVDFAPTVLSLAGIPRPQPMQGEAFLGTHEAPPRESVYLFRSRMDERYDLARGVRDKRYKYIRNFMPNLPWGQKLSTLWKARSMTAWHDAYLAGTLDATQRRFFEPKAVEELYDTKADPHEVTNLAADPAYADTLLRLRTACFVRMSDIRDAGLLPEGEMVARAEGTTIFENAQSGANYDLSAYTQAAELANARDPKHLPQLQEMLTNQDSGVRYWGASGLQCLGDAAQPVVPDLINVLTDESPDVRTIAAWALCGLGETAKALPVLEENLYHESEPVALLAANALQYIGEPAHPVVERYLVKDAAPNKYLQRVMDDIRMHLGTGE